MRFDIILNEEHNRLFLQKVKIDQNSKPERGLQLNLAKDIIPKNSKLSNLSYLSKNNINYDFSEIKKT